MPVIVIGTIHIVWLASLTLETLRGKGSRMFLVQQKTSNLRQRQGAQLKEHLADSLLISEQGSLLAQAFYDRDIS